MFRMRALIFAVFLVCVADAGNTELAREASILTTILQQTGNFIHLTKMSLDLEYLLAKIEMVKSYMSDVYFSGTNLHQDLC
jgi:hypothetical protein